MNLQFSQSLQELTIGNALLFVVGLIIVVVAANRIFGFFFKSSGWTEREEAMRDRLKSMDTTIQVLSQQLNEKAQLEGELRAQVKEQGKELANFKDLLANMQRQLDISNGEVVRLKKELETYNVLPKTAPKLTILGIWPDNPNLPELNTEGEQDAMYNSRLEFVPLKGAAANKDGVVLEMDRVKPEILEMGMHDDGMGNPMLADGVTEPGWWGQLVEDRDPRIMLAVLLYCRSNMQDRMNVSDVLTRSGVQYVISFNTPVEDIEAVKFARMLYLKIAEGMTVVQAMNRAKLVVNRRTQDMVRLRESTR